MFGFFKRKNKKTTKQPSEAPSRLTGTQLHYDPELVGVLMGDHKELLQLYGKIGQALKEDDYRKIKTLLADFSAKLRKHLLTENVKLYVYLKHALVNDHDSYDIVMSFKREMSQIGQVVNRFLMKYSDEEWQQGYAESFPKEYKAIGDALVKRITQEESILYELYLPPSAYSESR